MIGFSSLCRFAFLVIRKLKTVFPEKSKQERSMIGKAARTTLWQERTMQPDFVCCCDLEYAFN